MASLPLTSVFFLEVDNCSTRKFMYITVDFLFNARALILSSEASSDVGCCCLFKSRWTLVAHPSLKVIFIISLFHVIMRGGVGVTPHRVEEDIFNIRKC